jgi:hypothetical protein
MVSCKQQGGYVALMAVLIVGAAATAIALVLLTTGADSSRAMLIEQQGAQARNLATSCAEEALQIMHDTTSFTGTNNLTQGQGTCTYTVTSTGSSTRVIDASGFVSGVTKKLKVYVTITSSSLSITSWQEVADA